MRQQLVYRLHEVVEAEPAIVAFAVEPVELVCGIAKEHRILE